MADEGCVHRVIDGATPQGPYRDGSAAAATALPLAHAVADQLGAIVEIFHVATADARDPELWRRLHTNLRAMDWVQIRSNVADPVMAILQATREPSVEIVVLTTHGRVVEAGRSLGRVAQEVISATRQPVLLVRPEAASASGVGPLRRLLLPLDGSVATATALRPANTRFAGEHYSDAVVLVRRSQFEAGRAPVLRAVLDHVPCPVLLAAALRQPAADRHASALRRIHAPQR